MHTKVENHCLRRELYYNWSNLCYMRYAHLGVITKNRTWGTGQTKTTCIHYMSFLSKLIYRNDSLPHSQEKGKEGIICGPG